MPKSSSKGLSPKTFKGLNKTKIQQKGAGSGKRVAFNRDDPTVVLQFLQDPDEFLEYEIHSFQEEGRWQFVPCAGDNCPLCESDNQDIASTSYRFAANVYNHSTRKVQVLEGPKTVAGLVFFRFERKPALFLKRVFELTKFPTTPVTYDLALSDDASPAKVPTGKLHDLDEYVEEEMKRYYGDDLPGSDSDALEDDEEEDDIDDDDEEEAPPKKRAAKPPVKKAATKKVAPPEDDEDDDDLDELDLDDDEEEDDEEPEPPKRRKPAKTTKKKPPVVEEDDDDDLDLDLDDEDEDDEPAKPVKRRRRA